MWQTIHDHFHFSPRTCVWAQSCVVAVISIRRGIRAFFSFHSLLINIYHHTGEHHTSEICLRIARLKRKRPSKRENFPLDEIDPSISRPSPDSPSSFFIIPKRIHFYLLIFIYLYIYFFQDFSNCLSHLTDSLIILYYGFEIKFFLSKKWRLRNVNVILWRFLFKFWKMKISV